MASPSTKSGTSSEKSGTSGNPAVSDKSAAGSDKSPSKSGAGSDKRDSTNEETEKKKVSVRFANRDYKDYLQGPKPFFFPIEDPFLTEPEFIYESIFIPKEVDPPFIDAVLPMSIPQSGIFYRSYAYYSLKERMPVFLTKLIDFFSREQEKLKTKYSVNDDDIKSIIENIAKMKHDLVTNKPFELFVIDKDKMTPEEMADADEWNKWMMILDWRRYYNNLFLWTECYIFRKIREFIYLVPALKTYDPWTRDKRENFFDNIVSACVLADSMVGMTKEGRKPAQKLQGFMDIASVCMWANRCDIYWSMGESVVLTSPDPTENIADPIAMLPLLIDNFIADDTEKYYTMITEERIPLLKEQMDELKGQEVDFSCSCNRLAEAAGMDLCPGAQPKPPPGEEPPAPPPKKGKKAKGPPPPPPCITKVTLPECFIFDIVCENAGYELFTDLCFGTYLIKNGLANKVRFHVKEIPWFVSNATANDFRSLIDACKELDYNQDVPLKKADPNLDSEVSSMASKSTKSDKKSSGTRKVSGDNVQKFGKQWQEWLDDGTFLLMSENYWTLPYFYRDMKTRDYWLFRKLQMAVGAIVKGDLNYRKMVCDINTNPANPFEPSIQGFDPCPILAVRAIKSEIVCGLKKGLKDAIAAEDPDGALWLTTGRYGVIHCSTKSDIIRKIDRPCPDYGKICKGLKCANMADFYGGVTVEPPKPAAKAPSKKK